MDEKKFEQQFDRLADLFMKELGEVTNQLTAMTDRLTALEGKVAGTNRRLDSDAMARQDEDLPGRVEAIENHLGINA